MHALNRLLRTAPIRSQSGFTLVELMVTLALAAVLVSLAIPSFSRQLREWQRDSATRAFTSHVQLARSEAIKTSRRVVICASDDGEECSDSNEWGTGWLVFIDNDGDGDIDSGESLLVAQGAPTGLTSMLASGDVRRLAFLPNGLMASNATTLQIIPLGSSQIKMNEVTVNRIGRTYVKAEDRET